MEFPNSEHFRPVAKLRFCRTRGEEGERGKEIAAGMRAWAPTPSVILDVAHLMFHFISRGVSIPVTRFTGSVCLDDLPPRMNPFRSEALSALCWSSAHNPLRTPCTRASTPGWGWISSLFALHSAVHCRSLPFTGTTTPGPPRRTPSAGGFPARPTGRFAPPNRSFRGTSPAW